MSELINAYKSFVDEIVKLHDQALTLQQLATIEDHRENHAHSLLDKLDEESVKHVNWLCHRINEIGIFQVLETLNKFLEQGRLHLVWEGIELPLRPFGNELEIDWNERILGKNWMDDDTCPLHREKLHIDDHVPIAYGVDPYPFEYYDALKQKFPMANALIERGLEKQMGNFAVFPYCETCRRELAKWSRETGHRVGLPPDSKAFLKKYAK